MIPNWRSSPPFPVKSYFPQDVNLDKTTEALLRLRGKGGTEEQHSVLFAQKPSAHQTFPYNNCALTFFKSSASCLTCRLSFQLIRCGPHTDYSLSLFICQFQFHNPDTGHLNCTGIPNTVAHPYMYSADFCTLKGQGSIWPQLHPTGWFVTFTCRSIFETERFH